jgi:hypothetical protein
VIFNSINNYSAYELYTAATSSTKKRGATATVSKATNKEKDFEEAERLCARFKTTLSRPGVKVHFVGAW